MVTASEINLPPATPKYKIGDPVIFINEYGINFGKRIVANIEHNPIRGITYYITPTDTPWFATNEANLIHPDDKAGIDAKTLTHYH